MSDVIGCEKLDDEVESFEVGEDGIVSSEFVLIKDLDHETLTMLFEQSPDWVMSNRPDWVKQHHPDKIN